MEKKMATHSGILAWRIPWTEELGRLQSMGLQRPGHDSATVKEQCLYNIQSLFLPVSLNYSCMF